MSINSDIILRTKFKDAKKKKKKKKKRKKILQCTFGVLNQEQQIGSLVLQTTF